MNLNITTWYVIVSALGIFAAYLKGLDKATDEMSQKFMDEMQEAKKLRGNITQECWHQKEKLKERLK